MAEGFDTFLAAGTWPRRTALRALVSVARRPRGAAVLARAGAVGWLGEAMNGLRRYDDPAVAGSLGWDPEAVVARGRELRREGD